MAAQLVASRVVLSSTLLVSWLVNESVWEDCVILPRGSTERQGKKLDRKNVK
jgi:hypothetical protein